MREDRAAESVLIGRIKLVTLWGLGLLWLLDTALQFQPEMFTVDFVSDIMKPSIATDPSFLGALSNWTLGWVSPNIGDWNWVFALTQLTIAACLLFGLIRKYRPAILAGLSISIVWGLTVWIFGEGTSGVFTGSATLLTGAPGSVMLYVLLAVFCLLPDRFWNLSARFCLPRDALALLFLYGALVQAITPAFWGSQGISVLIEGQAAMAPSWMLSSLQPAVTITHANPVLWNAVYSVWLLLVGLLMFGRRPKTLGFILLGAVLVLTWYWGQAVGGMFNGMGTDPNTPPLLVLMAMPAWVVWRRRRQGQPSREPGGARPTLDRGSPT